MKLKQNLSLSVKEANYHIRNIAKTIENKCGVCVNIDDNKWCGFGKAYVSMRGDFHLDINSKMKMEVKLFGTYVDDIDFLKTICSLYHEQQHIIQNCKTYYDKEPTDNTIMMSIRNLACENNPVYYNKHNRYNNDLSEIEAEATAIANTYDYIRSKFNNIDADLLICNLVNNKIMISDYFIKGQYKSFNEIVKAFSEHYEEAKESEVSGYFAYALRMTDDINETKDECIRYLQACVRENPDEMRLMTKFNSASKQSERDLMIASITCHLHSEINYERVYPCLRCVDLSPENIFGRTLPEPPEGLIKEIPREKIERRIEIADSIYKRITANEYREYLSEMKTDVDLNKSLDIKYDNDKNKTYEP